MLCSYPPADRYHCPNFDLTPHKKFREVNRAFAQFCGAAWNPAPAPDLRTMKVHSAGRATEAPQTETEKCDLPAAQIGAMCKKQRGPDR